MIANSAHFDEMSHLAASHLVLHCLLFFLFVGLYTFNALRNQFLKSS